ncbi:MAG TPA: hypothetical protein VFJ19_09795 [Nocardioidaceae bacterium]|nr:hypothetical protein [Nocardioidaceae bacterium]
MNKSKAARVAGFVGALGASASLVGYAATSTGAYFTDSEPGSLSGQTGNLQINAQHTNLKFSDLVPGDYVDKTITYRTNSSTPEDIWLYFPETTAYEAFTGAKGNSRYSSGGMGRYGHFAVANSGSQTVFSSYNLQNASDDYTSDTYSGCANADGRGFGPKATSEADTPALCGVPHYILIDSNVASGTSGHLTITFGVTGRQTEQNQAAPPLSVPFDVVATQHGHRPDDPNF